MPHIEHMTRMESETEKKYPSHAQQEQICYTRPLEYLECVNIDGKWKRETTQNATYGSVVRRETSKREKRPELYNLSAE